jgi:hypothetical protein
MSPPSCSIGGPWRLHGSTLETSTTTHTPLLPHYQHESARWVIVCLPNSSWVLVSEGGLVGSGELRQVSEYPIPHGEQCHSCILRSCNFCTLKRRFRSVTGLLSKMLSRLFPLPPQGANRRGHLRNPTNPQPMKRTHLTLTQTQS